MQRAAGRGGEATAIAPGLLRSVRSLTSANEICAEGGHPLGHAFRAPGLGVGQRRGRKSLALLGVVESCGDDFGEGDRVRRARCGSLGPRRARPWCLSPPRPPGVCLGSRLQQHEALGLNARREHESVCYPVTIRQFPLPVESRRSNICPDGPKRRTLRCSPRTAGLSAMTSMASGQEGCRVAGIRKPITSKIRPPNGASGYLGGSFKTQWKSVHLP